MGNITNCVCITWEFYRRLWSQALRILLRMVRYWIHSVRGSNISVWSEIARRARTAKSMSYKEFVFHCYQFHGVMKRSLTAAQKLAKAADKEKYERLITTVCDVPGRNLGDPEFRIDEIHDCLLCNGVFKETNKENKEAKGMRLNLCVTRNHYALCMHDDEEGLAFYKKMYPLPEERPETIHQFKCQEEECLKDKRFRQGVNYKQFASHNALYHGGLDMFLEKHPRQEMRDMVDKLRCSKVPDRCYVPDHYGC